MLKNIIFDVGDVLLEYRWKDMLMEYGLEEEEAVRVESTAFERKGTGDISVVQLLGSVV